MGAALGIAASETERRTLTGDVAGAHALLEALVRETKTDGRATLRIAATKAVDRLGAGPIARHVGMHFRTVIDSDVDRFNQLCQLLGPSVVRSLADALAREENAVAIRRLAALLLSFGAAGRRSVEQLKNSPNPAVRRTAVTLLRRAGGQEALLELASMLGDDDPEVQRESIHAMVEIGTANAYSVLHRLLLEADTPRESALRELLSLRDDKAVPLFSYVLTKGEPQGKLIGIHISMIEALGVMRPRPESIRALQQVLCGGAGGHHSERRRSGRRRPPLCADSGRRRLSRSRSRRHRRRPAVSERSRERRSHMFPETGEEHDMSVPQRSRLADELSRRLAAAIRGAQLYAPAHPLVTRSARALIDTAHTGSSIGRLGRHRHRRRRARRRRSASPASGRDDERVDASPSATRHRAHRHRPRRGGGRIQQLVDVVARGDGGDSTAALRHLPHIRVGRLEMEEQISTSSGDIATFRRLYDDAVKVAEDLWDSASTEGAPDSDAAREMVDSLAQAVAQNRTALLSLTALKNYDNYTFTHMVNVSILTMGQARGVGIDGALLREFGMAALMHDIGKVQTPNEILNKPGALTDEEFTILNATRRRRRDPSKDAGDAALAPIVAFEHHLRADGTGYPPACGRS